MEASCSASPFSSARRNASEMCAVLGLPPGFPLTPFANGFKFSTRSGHCFLAVLSESYALRREHKSAKLGASNRAIGTRSQKGEGRHPGLDALHYAVLLNSSAGVE